MYIAAEDKVIGVVLTQETEGKEHVVTYIEIDPDRIKSIRNVGPPTCKVEV